MGESTAFSWPVLFDLLIRPSIKYFLNGFLKDFARLHRSSLRLGSRDDHLAFREDQGGGLWVSDPHHDSWEPAWIVLCVAAAHRDFSQVELCAVEVSRCDKVLQRGRLNLA